jgi:predicted DNA repair protein MutK
LAYEGAEKYTILFPHEHAKHEISLEPMTEEQILAFEKKKIKSAIVTDFILSVEIVIIALGTVIEQTHFITNNGRNYHCNHMMGVYGISMIVRMDRSRLKLIKVNSNEGSFAIN